MSAASRRRRQFAIGFRHRSRLPGKHTAGGRPIYPSTSGLSVAAAIARERAAAARAMAAKGKKKK